MSVEQNNQDNKGGNLDHQPVLLDEPYGEHKKTGAPYILIAILIFIILSSFWKVFMIEKKKGNEAPDSSIENVVNGSQGRQGNME